MDHRSARRQIPAEIVLVGYRDPAAEVCFGPDDPYGLECLVPVVGPSSYLMWVKIARRVLTEGGPVRFDVVDLFRSIGLGHADRPQQRRGPDPGPHDHLRDAPGHP